ncbi:MAG: hypothetical protein IJ408_04740 [Clostridia bacterium]|nr:hypothetical protein [Clostridia bacterium]
MSQNKNKVFRIYLIACFLSAAFICFAQIVSSTPLIMAGMLLFLAISATSAFHDFSIPVLLFFLPWSTIIKLAPGSISFYTIALIAVCVITFLRSSLKLNVKSTLFGIMLILISLISKLMDGSSIAMSYLMFMFLIILLPNVTSEIGRFSDFKTMTLFFSFGIIAAALSAQQLANIPTIAKYIDVYNWNIITRFSGYYGDANFYSAQISAAISGVLLLMLSEKTKRGSFFLLVLSIVLLYCGFISASKAFTITIITVSILWLIAIFGMRGRPYFKTYIIFICIVAVIFIFTSGIFGALIDVIAFRFSQSNNIDGFTTGRTERWMDYLREVLGNPKVLILGKGFNNVKLNDLGSHNTPLQIIYQFGIVSGSALLAWLINFIKLIMGRIEKRASIMYTLLLLIGVFLPWFAIDMLFFDEFFLMPVYVCTGILYFSHSEKEE